MPTLHDYLGGAVDGLALCLTPQPGKGQGEHDHLSVRSEL